MSNQKQPKLKFGFYAVTPRIVRTKYKDLSHTEKWLYVCLKDLCGDKGTCFRTLRALSEETDISTGSLSKMVPNLHRAGLIHAEKKRRTESGKEVWHISITDIWTENVKACSNAEQSTEVVQNSNKDVQNVNENAPDCSNSEKDCSNFSDRRNNSEEVTSEERTREEKPTSVQQTSNSSQPADSFSPSLSQKSSEETKPLEVDYPLFDRLCQGKGYAADFKVPRNEKNNAAIQELRSQSATPEQVAFVFNDLWNDKDPFWQQHRGKPSTVASQFTARVWKMTTPAPKRQTASGFTNWTEDKTVGTIPTAPKATEKPKEPSLPVGYTRLKIDKPRGPRSLQARLEAQK
jgi:predicted transcriptional regulator